MFTFKQTFQSPNGTVSANDPSLSCHHNHSWLYFFLSQAYKSCPMWTRKVLNNEATYHEQKLYEKSLEFEAMVAAVSGRLGYNEPVPLGEKRVLVVLLPYCCAW